MIINYIQYDDPTNVYTAIQYPAGELQVRIKPEYADEIELAQTITIRARLTDVNGMLNSNIIGLLQLTDAVRGLNRKAALSLHLPYLPYSRGDRRFTVGDCHGLGVFGDILRHKFDQVVTLDVHHLHKAFMYVDHLVNIQPLSLIKNAVKKFAARTNSKKITVLFPDAGAVKRYPAEIFSGHQVLHAEKCRDKTTGEFKAFSVPATASFETDSVLIVDDICDGGGTFVGIAEALLNQGFVPRQGLYVTHGIFSKGFSELDSHFEAVYATDSVLPDDYLRTLSNRIEVHSAFDALVNPVNTPSVVGVGRAV